MAPCPMANTIITATPGGGRASRAARHPSSPRRGAVVANACWWSGWRDGAAGVRWASPSRGSGGVGAKAARPSRLLSRAPPAPVPALGCSNGVRRQPRHGPAVCRRKRTSRGGGARWRPSPASAWPVTGASGAPRVPSPGGPSARQPTGSTPRLIRSTRGWMNCSGRRRHPGRSGRWPASPRTASACTTPCASACHGWCAPRGRLPRSSPLLAVRSHSASVTTT